MTASEFTHLIHPFKDRVFRLAKRLLVSTQEAEDATQEVMLKLWSQKNKLSEYKSLEAMSITITRNFCLDRLKSKQAQTTRLPDTVFLKKARSLQQEIEDRDSLDVVRQIISHLPERQQTIIQLRDIEGYDYPEIAQMLDMKPTTVRVTLSRARKTIKEQLLKKHAHGVI